MNKKYSIIIPVYNSDKSLEEWLQERGVVGISGIDTRALVRHIRDKGAMKGAIMTGEVSHDELRQRMDAEPAMLGRDLVKEVTCPEAYAWTEGLMRFAGEDYTLVRAPLDEAEGAGADRIFEVVSAIFLYRTRADSGAEIHRQVG